MPQTVVYIATSLDGYIATPDGSVDWLKPFESFDYGYNQFLAAIDRVIMGRKTFDQCLTLGPWPYEGKVVHVMTHRPIKNPHSGVSPYSGGVDGLVIQMGVQGAKNAWIVGGTDIIQQFMDRDLVDTFEIYVIPILLGSGIPLFRPAQQPINLINQSVKRFDNGVVCLTYKRN